MFLGDFGADIIRIDSPAGVIEQLDDLDSGGTVSAEKYAAYCVTDRNKRSIIVNLKHEEGQAALYKLVKKADVLVILWYSSFKCRIQIPTFPARD